METPFEKPAVSQHDKERSGQFKANPIWADHERPEDHGDVLNSAVKETRQEEITRLLGRDHAKDIDVKGYESNSDR
jgi:hypothetical protein